VSKAQSQPRYQQLKLAMDIPSAAEPQRQPKSRAEGHTEKLKLGKRKAERPEVRGQRPEVSGVLERREDVLTPDRRRVYGVGATSDSIPKADQSRGFRLCQV
jgi:hypothetical protein